jgi:hypothetical protein
MNWDCIGAGGWSDKACKDEGLGLKCVHEKDLGSRGAYSLGTVDWL